MNRFKEILIIVAVVLIVVLAVDYLVPLVGF